MLTVLVERRGIVEETDTVDPAWLLPEATETLWADLTGPVEADRQLLGEVFRIHELAVEDAIGETHHPKMSPMAPCCI